MRLDLSRQNIMKQAASLNFASDMMLPGIKISTSATDFFPIEQLRSFDSTGRRGSRSERCSARGSEDRLMA